MSATEFVIKVLQNMVYKNIVICTNCKNKQSITIMKRKKIEDALKMERCSNCGCIALTRAD